MPVKGVTDRFRLKRIGHVKLGEPKQPNRPGRALDHFRPVFDNPEHLEAFSTTYGEKPDRLRIAFASNNIDDNMSVFLRCYGSNSGIKCKGDGEVIIQRPGEPGLVGSACPGIDEHGEMLCPFGKTNGCVVCSFMRFFLFGIGEVGLVQLNTKSYNGILDIQSDLVMMQSVRGADGIAGVWVDLVLAPRQVQVGNTMKKVRTLHLDWGVGIEKVIGLTSVLETKRMLPPPDETRDTLLFAEHADDGEPEDDSQDAGRAIHKGLLDGAAGRGYSTAEFYQALFAATDQHLIITCQTVDDLEYVDMEDWTRLVIALDEWLPQRMSMEAAASADVAEITEGEGVAGQLFPDS